MSFPPVIELHCEEWKDDFAREAANVRVALGSVLRAIHHIGSTAVLGLRAKPVIDMLADVDCLATLDARAESMVGLGYEVMGEFGIPGRRYFRKSNSAGTRTHHLHAFATGSPHIARHLAFRDYLRTHSVTAAEYGALKLRLASTCGGDMEAYIAGKEAFVQRVEQEALEWRATTVPEE